MRRRFRIVILRVVLRSTDQMDTSSRASSGVARGNTQSTVPDARAISGVQMVIFGISGSGSHGG